MDRTLQISKKRRAFPLYINALIIVGAVLSFLFSIHLMGLAFNTLGKDAARSVLEVTSNPFVGLFIGLLVTAILQSSSTTTSMVVIAVASNSISLAHAIPIVMGANVGTTITSTIVSLSYITKAHEFRRAIAVGTAHDIFNIITVLLLFPLELNYQILSKLSASIGSLINSTASSSSSVLPYGFDVFTPLSHGLLDLFGPLLILVLSFSLLLITVKYISNLLYQQMIGDARRNLDDLFFRTKFKSFGWGFLLTAIIQSSSLTTSLIVPFVATGKVKLRMAFQFILGANLGTTITAILAATFKSDAAISLAIAHFLFNLIGVSLFLLIPTINRIPTFIADKLGYLTLKFRLIGFAYILITFFVLPFSLISLSNDKSWIVQDKTKTAPLVLEE